MTNSSAGTARGVSHMSAPATRTIATGGILTLRTGIVPTMSRGGFEQGRLGASGQNRSYISAEYRIEPETEARPIIRHPSIVDQQVVEEIEHSVAHHGGRYQPKLALEAEHR